MLAIAEEQLAGLELQPSIRVDLQLPLREVKGRLIKLIDLLAPFGYGNLPPTFLSKGLRVVEARSLGDGGKHLKLKLRDDPIVWDAIGFDLGDLAAHLTPYLDIVYRLMVDQWGGREVLKLELLDLAPSSQAAAEA